ncbi:hypothetical protein NLG97_g510 [Lecanicillium saksenae]|uniref:Uncharacterized protein n=1 Tax=Lecanicillium saksenae TaxID=468837 RepID=A0ACC1R882_9HYPO|nr:hypothetical protein NLG97_g510 [Lecanicillium saksenae]
MMAQSSQIITLKQLAEHATADSLWIAVHGHVYDLTTFRSDHPGGTEALESCAGTDGTESYEYAGHSKSNTTKMKQFRIGKLDGAVARAAELLPATVGRDIVRVRPKSIQDPGWGKRMTLMAMATLTISLLYYWKVASSISKSETAETKTSIISDNSSLNVNRAFWAGLALASSLASDDGLPAHGGFAGPVGAFLALASGALCYICHFNRGEHHLYGVSYLKTHTVAFLGLTALFYRLGLTPVDALLRTCLYDGLFLSGLYASLFFYRAFLNPLNVFPGPWTARITSLDLPLRIRNNKLYKTLDELHGKHGHFVRVGAGEVSITHPHAVQEIFGGYSKCLKSPWYDISRPQDSLLLRRSHAGHNELRRIWSPAFSTKAVRGYETRIQPYRNKLIAGLDAHDGKSLDVDHWLALYAWDVMGDLTFGHSFGMLDTKEQHWAIKTLNKGMSVIGTHLPMWVFRVMVAIPGGQEDFKVMLKYTQEEMLSRWNSEPKLPDVMSHLFVPYKTGKKAWDDTAINLMAGESHLLINAGSDTTRTTLACALFELTKQPEYIRKLREELQPLLSGSSDDEILDHQISTNELLNGIIWEALRLFPPNPSHPTRVTPPEGVMIAGRFVAGGTQVMAPQYVIGRDEKIYPRASEFIPERWYSSPDLVTDKKATAPFSIGPYNCIGKPLAMMNIRITLARIIMRYNLTFDPDRADPQAEFVDGMSDHFTLQPGPLYLRLEKRH